MGHDPNSPHHVPHYSHEPGAAIEDQPQGQPRHARNATIIWIISSIIGMVLVGFATPHILPVNASDAQDFANLTLVVFTVASVPVAFFVWVFLAYSLIVFRVKGRPENDGPALQPGIVTQVGWLGITGALCLFLLVWGLLAMYQQGQAAAADAPRELRVNVTGQQWTWTYYYPKYHVDSHTLLLPVNQPVAFNVVSKDVLHGFAITELGVRIDANPDQPVVTPMVVPKRVGGYHTRCVELCGLYHSFMFTNVYVVTPSQFKTWIAKQGGHA